MMYAGDSTNLSILVGLMVSSVIYFVIYLNTITLHREYVFLMMPGKVLHQSPSDRSAPKEAAKSIKNTTAYTPLKDALSHKWSGLTRRQTKELNPAVMFTVLGEPSSRHRGDYVIHGLSVDMQHFGSTRQRTETYLTVSPMPVISRLQQSHY